MKPKKTKAVATAPVDEDAKGVGKSAILVKPKYFYRETRGMRSFGRDGDPNDKLRFVGKDVCEMLGIENARSSMTDLPDWCRGEPTLVSTPGGPQLMATVNEPGLYMLAFRSRKKEAEAFCRWVCEDVLPAIRKTGSYAMRQPPQPKPAPQPQQLRIDTLVVERAMMMIHDRTLFAVRSHTETPGESPQYYSVTRPHKALSQHELAKLVEGRSLCPWLPHASPEERENAVGKFFATHIGYSFKHDIWRLTLRSDGMARPSYTVEATSVDAPKLPCHCDAAPYPHQPSHLSCRYRGTLGW